MKHLKCKMIALLLALVFAGSVGASTLVTTPGTITATGFFGNSFATAGYFDDFVQFTIGAPNSAMSWAATSVNFGPMSGPLYGISLFNSDLYAGTLTSVAGLPVASGTTSSGLLPGTSPAFWISATAGTDGPLSGAYTLHVYGVVAASGGSYAGTIALAPVPEPGEWALMLSGIGLIGFMLRRRSSNAV